MVRNHRGFLAVIVAAAVLAAGVVAAVVVLATGFPIRPRPTATACSAGW